MSREFIRSSNSAQVYIFFSELLPMGGGIFNELGIKNQKWDIKRQVYLFLRFGQPYKSSEKKMIF